MPATRIATRRRASLQDLLDQEGVSATSGVSGGETMGSSSGSEGAAPESEGTFASMSADKQSARPSLYDLGQSAAVRDGQGRPVESTNGHTWTSEAGRAALKEAARAEVIRQMGEGDFEFNSPVAREAMQIHAEGLVDALFSADNPSAQSRLLQSVKSAAGNEDLLTAHTVQNMEEVSQSFAGFSGLEAQELESVPMASALLSLQNYRLEVEAAAQPLGMQGHDTQARAYADLLLARLPNTELLAKAEHHFSRGVDAVNERKDPEALAEIGRELFQAANQLDVTRPAQANYAQALRGFAQSLEVQDEAATVSSAYVAIDAGAVAAKDLLLQTNEALMAPDAVLQRKQIYERMDVHLEQYLQGAPSAEELFVPATEQAAKHLNLGRELLGPDALHLSDAQMRNLVCSLPLEKAEQLGLTAEHVAEAVRELRQEAMERGEDVTTIDACVALEALVLREEARERATEQGAAEQTSKVGPESSSAHDSQALESRAEVEEEAHAELDAPGD